MKSIHQTKFGKPDGNCLAAAIASILEIPLEDVPSFGVDDEWFTRFSRWARSTHALEPLMATTEGDWFPAGFHLMAGQSPRGDFKHCVVAFAGKIVHDPHPSGDGLASVDTWTAFALLDPRISPENGARGNDGDKCHAPDCDTPTGMLSLAGAAMIMGDVTFCSEHCVEIWLDSHEEPVKA